MSGDQGDLAEPTDATERRHNHELRERLEQLTILARELSQKRDELSDRELEEARERIEWLAEEIWNAAVYGPLSERNLPRDE